jgi:Acetoacetate decarboxylase (ADC)
LYKDFDPVVLTILDQAEPESLKLWTLLDMDKLPTWINDKLALLGDAAHPLLPRKANTLRSVHDAYEWSDQAQGGAAAIEDALSLSAVLPFGTRPADVPERLHLYEKIRYERAHAIQQFTRLAGRDLDQQDGGKLDSMFSSESFLRLTRRNLVTKYTNYNFGHDEWHNSNHELRKHLWSKLSAKSWRQPLGFGPSSRPMASHFEFTKRSIRFKTSRTYLQTLFPSPAFSFTTPGTVVEATFQVETVDKLGGYNSFGLWIHGVQYTKRDGTNIFGTYLPVVFETLSDSITAGREELGMPKVFCDIEVDERNSSAYVVCSWRGATFATLEWESLTKDHPESNSKAKDSAPAHDPRSPPPPPDSGLLIYKYVPAVGNLGHSDAEYPVFIPNKASSRSRVVQAFNARSAKVNITAGNGDTLPTIHHIAQGLSEVPIYSIVEAKVERGQRRDDFSEAEKLEESTRSIGPHL